MNDQIEITEEKATTVLEPVLNIGRKAMYLGLGTVGLMGDGVKGVFSKGGDYTNKIIVRGESVATGTRGRVAKLIDNPQEVAKGTVKKAGETFDKYSEQVLTRVHVPTSEDIDSVTKKVASIERKLDKAIKDGVAATTK